MRFLGKHINSNGQPHQNFSVVSDFKRRAEGVRIKHSVNGNSVKLYDKAIALTIRVWQVWVLAESPWQAPAGEIDRLV
jgi:hypothetical protein